MQIDREHSATGKLSRRHMLLAASGAISGGAMLAVTQPLWSAGGEAGPSVNELTKQLKGYRRYYVVPTSLKAFTEQRRKELNVIGPQQGALNCSNKQCRAPGFMAWLEPIAAGKLAMKEEVKTVYELTADDVPILGNIKDSKGKLTVIVAPNGWATEPEADTFLATADLANHWEADLKEFAAVAVTANNKGQEIRGRALTRHVSVGVQFEDAEVPESALKYLRSNPQSKQILTAGVIHLNQPGGGFLDGCPGCGLG